MSYYVVCTHPQHAAEDRGVLFFAPCFQCKGLRKILVGGTQDVQDVSIQKVDSQNQEENHLPDSMQLRRDDDSQETLERQQ